MTPVSNPFPSRESLRNARKKGNDEDDIDLRKAADECISGAFGSKASPELKSAESLTKLPADVRDIGESLDSENASEKDPRFSFSDGNRHSIQKVIVDCGSSTFGNAANKSLIPKLRPISRGDKEKKRRRRARRGAKVPSAPDLKEFDMLNASGCIDAVLAAAEHSRIDKQPKTRSLKRRRSSKLPWHNKRLPVVLVNPSDFSKLDEDGLAPEGVTRTSSRSGGGHARSGYGEDSDYRPSAGPADGVPTRRYSLRSAGRRRWAGRAQSFDVIDLTGDDEDVDVRHQKKTETKPNAFAPPYVFGDIPVDEGESVEHPQLRPLKESDENLVAKLLRGGNSSQKISTIPSAGITLLWKDFALLRNVRWLNDELLNSYMALINDRNVRYWRGVDEGKIEAQRGRPRCFCFNTFFFTRLVASGYDYGGVARWTKRKKVDIMDLNYVIVPINVGNNHWVLVVLNIPDKELYYLDSLPGGDRIGAVSALQDWALDEIRDKRGSLAANAFEQKLWKVRFNHYQVKRNLSGSQINREESYPKIPLQRDGGSCGVFAAKMADCIALGIEAYFVSDNIQLVRRRMALELYQRILPG